MCISLQRETSSAPLDRITVWNSGAEFAEADWKRVQKIASGNTDASSVGLFGVGFYSTFKLGQSA